jgi:hypothetical protein
MELQGRSWPNLLGGVSGLGRPAHIGAVVADLDGLAGAGQARRSGIQRNLAPASRSGLFSVAGTGRSGNPF